MHGAERVEDQPLGRTMAGRKGSKAAVNTRDGEELFFFDGGATSSPAHTSNHN